MSFLTSQLANADKEPRTERGRKTLRRLLAERALLKAELEFNFSAQESECRF